MWREAACKIHLGVARSGLEKGRGVRGGRGTQLPALCPARCRVSAERGRNSEAATHLVKECPHKTCLFCAGVSGPGEVDVVRVAEQHGEVERARIGEGNGGRGRKVRGGACRGRVARRRKVSEGAEEVNRDVGHGEHVDAVHYGSHAPDFKGGKGEFGDAAEATDVENACGCYAVKEKNCTYSDTQEVAELGIEPRPIRHPPTELFYQQHKRSISSLAELGHQVTTRSGWWPDSAVTGHSLPTVFRIIKKSINYLPRPITYRTNIDCPWRRFVQKAPEAIQCNMVAGKEKMSVTVSHSRCKTSGEKPPSVGKERSGDVGGGEKGRPSATNSVAWYMHKDSSWPAVKDTERETLSVCGGRTWTWARWRREEGQLLSSAWCG
ncbi:hypothetical protein GGX14DRAFT_666475 [Mycena pura]|uniref:Uncharacterized protein n=1 Tax=Mycena pura TaxID=153505 RepID=A0AAD6V2Y9_9AGAR|nr:hypothetical protein GGX14DRAFT_666475 [Mycena pura]